MKLALTLMLLASTTFAEAPSLAGLWAARRDFGPEVRGTLTITADGNASIAGRSATSTIKSRAISFALPNDEGSFRGQIRGDRIEGHWIQPRGVSSGNPTATRVTLMKNALGQWTGTVTPVDDHMTFFMPVTAQADGTYATFLRNPERNVGKFLDVRRLVLDGNHVKLLGKDDSVRLQGTYQADDDTISVYVSSGNGTYDFHRSTAADEAMFYPRGKTPAAYVYRKPAARSDGWRVASVDEVGISRDAIAKFIDVLTSTPDDSVLATNTHAFMLARHGKLVVDEYFHGTNPDEPHDTRSAAKSVTPILAGVGKVKASTPVYETMYGASDSIDPRKRAITLEHLLTMSSGLDCDDSDPSSPGREDTMQEQEAQPDWYRFTLDLKMIRNPGEKAVYCSCQPNLAGGVISKVTGEWLPDLFRDRIANVMQIRGYGLNLTPTGNAYLGGGARFRPRDFMKLGQLLLDGGRWRGKPILSETWAKRTTSPLSEMRGMHYGYLWWITDVPYGNGTVRAFHAGGNGGQMVMAIPELDVVIAFFGGNYADSPATYMSQRTYVPKYVLPAIH